jgi:hypothetical protein
MKLIKDESNYVVQKIYRIVEDLLLLISPMTLLCFNVGGISIYPSFFLIFSLINGRDIRKQISQKERVIFLSLLSGIYAIASVTKQYLLVDVFRLIIMFLMYVYMCKNATREKTLFLLDIAIIMIVMYGVFQYVCSMLGLDESAIWLHQLIPSDLVGGVIDNRGGTLRVASLTREPSYFAFTIGVYLFITKRIIVKIFCILGFFLSFSFISIYAICGIVIYYLINKFTQLPVFFYITSIIIIHLFVASNFDHLSTMLPSDIMETFETRYYGLIKFVKSRDIIDIMTGLTSTINGTDAVDNSYLQRAYCNISSVAVNFGCVGLCLYAYAMSQLGKVNPLGALAIFFYGFNFYYLTGWAIFPVFIYLITVQDDLTDRVHNSQIQSMYL